MQATDGACVTSVCRVPGREPWKVETAAIKGCVCLLSLYGAKGTRDLLLNYGTR